MIAGLRQRDHLRAADAFVPGEQRDTVHDARRCDQLVGRIASNVEPGRDSRHLEVENHSFCNRVCWFCPNRFYDRRSALVRMTDRVFDGIITALASIGYEEALTWSRYHGAMVDERVSMRASPVPGPPFPAPGW